MEFLLEAAPDFYAEVKDVYVESMGKTLHALFRTYAAQLMRLLDVIATRQDVLAMDEANLRDNFTNKINFSKRTTDSFHLGSRANLSLLLPMITLFPIVTRKIDTEDTHFDAQPVSLSSTFKLGHSILFQTLY